MITLEIKDLQWLNGAEDNPDDQCAHGRVDFRINGTKFVDPEDGVWAVNAAALYLLRTLTENHSKENSVAEGNLLFPHCGFNPWRVGNRFEVMLMGCDIGVDPEVLHESDRIVVRLDSVSESVPIAEWRSAVIAFAESVMEFYKISAPKSAIENDLDREGWIAFWQEWKERYVSGE